MRIGLEGYSNDAWDCAITGTEPQLAAMIAAATLRIEMFTLYLLIACCRPEVNHEAMHGVRCAFV
jgi:hypothetical protein